MGANSVFNGGGNYGSGNAGSGGGATDFRLVSGAWNDDLSLDSRLMVAAGGGGAARSGVNHPGQHAGGLKGAGTSDYYAAGGGGQIAGGSGSQYATGTSGGFGAGDSK